MSEMDESKTSFARWLWNGLRWFTGLSAKFRSDKEKRLGPGLLVPFTDWPTPILSIFLTCNSRMRPNDTRAIFDVPERG